MADVANVDIAALANILNAIVSLTNENERLRNLVKQQASLSNTPPGPAGEGQEEG